MTIFKQSAVVLVLLAIVVVSGAANLEISEFMAINDSGLEDVDYDNEDWIEIHNSSTSSVNLAGWYLSDNPTNLDKWRFPRIIIEANGYLVVFASGKDRRNARAELHTNFKLSGDGEYLALVKPDGSVAHDYSPSYPQQVADLSYGIVSSGVSNLVLQGDFVYANSPTSELEFTTDYASWNTLGFANAGDWQFGQTGMGYDRNGGFDAWIGSGGDVESIAYNKNTSVFIRIPFVINDTNLTHLTLLMRFDDGFRAFINGTAVAEFSAPNPALWNSTATLNRDESLNNEWTVFDLTDYIGLLSQGTNLLAFQGFNIRLGSSDMLVLPELDGEYDMVDTMSYLHTPTPGFKNGAGSSDVGPVIRDTTERPSRPSGATGSPSLVITSKVVSALSPVQSVTLYHRHMFNTESSVVMTPIGTNLYTASIPVAGLGVGQMVRWRIEASDMRGIVSTDPPFFTADDYEEYFGTSTTDISYSNSLLPVVEWFVENYDDAGTEGGTRCSIFYMGSFYDNVLINQHGQSTAGFSKKSYNLDFSNDNRFLYQSGKRKVKDLRWMQNWADKTKVHITMSCETAKRVGTANMFAFPVRLQKNGKFDRITEMMEDGDDRWLERLGYDPEGALTKMYSETNGEKKTRRYQAPYYEVTRDESDSDDAARVTLFDNLVYTAPTVSRRQYIYDNMNIANCINYFVTANILSHQDHGHKNYYIYRDTNNSGEWSLFLWDLDLAWGRNWTGSTGYLSDILYANNALTFETPLQDKVYNRIYRAYHESPELRQIYLRRLRTCMDEILQAEDVPEADRLIEDRFEYWIDQIDPINITPSDADLDRAKWGYWGTDRNVREEWERTKSQYLTPRRRYLFDNDPNALLVEGESVPDSQPSNTLINFETVDYMPASGNAMEEYFTLLNTNDYAVDISGWSVTGGIQHVFSPGTVIPSGGGTNQNIGRFHVARLSSAFRARSGGSFAGQYIFVQDGYKGQLSARGENLVLLDTNGMQIDQLNFPGTPTESQLHLRVSELMYQPTDPTDAELAFDSYLLDTDFEFIEIVNTGINSIDMSGAQFSEGVQFTFPSGFNLAGGSYAIISANTNAFVIRYGGSATLAGQYDGYLDNGGETIVLLDPVGEKVIDFSYNDKWYPITAGNDFSLVISDASADWQTWGDSERWRASSHLRGSPGYEDPLPSEFIAVVVNEALTHTDFPQVDSIELFNPGSLSFNIGGWFLSDEFYSPKKFRIPEGTTLASHGYITFYENDFNSDSNSPASFQLSSTGDDIWLFSADGQTNLTGYYHGFAFGAAKNGVSFGRYITTIGEEHFPAQESLTLGFENSGPKVGPVVISEIMYNPADIGGVNNIRDEYIELTNISSAEVPLYSLLDVTNTWRVRSAVDFDFPRGAVLNAGERILLVGFDPREDLSMRTLRIVYGVSTNITVYGPWVGNLNNGGDTVKLKWPDSPNTNEVPYILAEEIHYSPTEPWPPDASGTGNSLQRIAGDRYGNDPVNWYAAEALPGRSANLELDSDGDRMNDWAEWNARTDPLDPDSVMRIESTKFMPSGYLQIPMSTVAGRCYALEYTTNIVAQEFSPLVENIEAVGEITTVTITNVNNAEGFYRMRLEP